MTLKDSKISEATIRVISRFGFKKTTMADIADEAKISRQSLYNAYPNKEAVLQASVRYIMEQDLNRVKQEWETLSSISEKIDCYFELGPITWFDRIQETPVAAEIIEGWGDVFEPALLEAHEQWISALAEVLGEELQQDQAAELADFIFITAKTAKMNAQNRAHLLSRLALLKEMTIKTYFS